MKNRRIPVFFHNDQLGHKPLFEWAFGEKIAHPETTSRAESILAALSADPARFEIRSPERFPLQALKSLHAPDLLTLYKSAKALPASETFYPSVYPKREDTACDPRNVKHAGFYCFDSGTPLNATTWAAAAWSAACAIEATRIVEKGKSVISYALCRPPGHHATRDLFGGYCYFNNAGLAARRLKEGGSRVAVLDIDFHHGNGTQSLFYADDRVFFVSIHGDPREFFPYFWGFSSEKGTGAGKGFNLNIPLPSGTDGQEYLRALDRQVLPAIRRFRPDHLVISAGFDGYVADPIGSFALETADFREIAGRLSALKLPTVIVQEGGYAAESLGTNVAAFLDGFRK